MIPSILFVTISLSINYNKDVKPIIEKRCAECHNATGCLPNWLDKSQMITYKESITNRLLSNDMPPGNVTKMTDKERLIIIRWLKSQ